MKGLKAKTRVALGQAGMIISLVMLASYIGIIPDKVSTVRQSRASLAETIAVYSTALVTHADAQRLKDDLNLIVERNEDLLSIALRRENGQFLVNTGNHENQWQVMSGEYSKENQLRVPILTGDEKWGQLELRFKSDSNGFLGVSKDSLIAITLFMGLSCFVIFYFYLGLVLRHLDPSKAIPARVRAALDTMAEGLLVLDRKEQIVLANRAFSDILDKSPTALLGAKASELPWQDKEGNKVTKANRPWIQALDSGEVQKDADLRIQLPGQRMLTFKVNCSPVLGAGKKYAGVLVSFNDVTQLEEQEVELRKSKVMAEEANQAKSAFLANMSHEIRTPMNAILGFADILKRGYVKNEQESLKYLNMIHSSGKSLLELINDILDLSKVESGVIEFEKVKVRPYAIIQEVVQNLDIKARENGIALSLEARTPLPEIIETDPARFRQIIYNLVGNAIKFTEQGGVTISCRFEKNSSGPRLFVDITDSGIGISPEAQKNIFEPFVQADSTVTRRFGGTGLGLSISHKFAQAMGGDITVASEPGKGSTFTVELATGNLDGVVFLQPDEVSVRRDEITVSGALRWLFSEGSVLVVDDSPENRELLRVLLEDAGVAVEEAQNGQVCIDKVAVKRYDLILMDVQMPVMDGFTATKILREKGIETPIIALTANAMKGFEQECLDKGYSGYISKPLNIDKFMEAVSIYFNGRLVQDDTVPATAAIKAQPSRPRSSEAHTPVVSRLANHPKLKNAVIKFVDKLGGETDKMKSALAKQDMQELASLAHWLKGSGGTVGYDAFTEPAQELEKCAKAGQLDKTSEVLEKIERLVEAVVPPAAD